MGKVEYLLSWMLDKGHREQETGEQAHTRFWFILELGKL